MTFFRGLSEANRPQPPQPDFEQRDVLQGERARTAQSSFEHIERDLGLRRDVEWVSNTNRAAQVSPQLVRHFVHKGIRQVAA